MGQRKNKTTKKQRKAMQNFNLIKDFTHNLNSFIDEDFDETPQGDIHYTDFVCSHCGIHEDIPTHIVMNFEFLDHDLPNYMPSFTCKKCGYDMFPTYFKGFNGKIYQYKFKG